MTGYIGSLMYAHRGLVTVWVVDFSVMPDSSLMYSCKSTIDVYLFFMGIQGVCHYFPFENKKLQNLEQPHQCITGKSLSIVKLDREGQPYLGIVYVNMNDVRGNEIETFHNPAK